MAIQNYRDLIAWQKAMSLAEAVYQATGNFPSDERFGLVQQIRRAGVSIPSNIAEGHARRSTQDFLRFLSIAYASRAEVETQAILANRLGYIDDETRSRLMTMTEEVGRLINGLANKLREKL